MYGFLHVKVLCHNICHNDDVTLIFGVNQKSNQKEHKSMN